MSNIPVVKEKVLIKIIVLGSSNVGKTSIMERFSGVRRPTVGSDFLTKRIDLHDYDVSLQIWDTAGQERFHQGSIGSPFYRGAHGALLVYDVNNESSIEQVFMWRDEVLSKVSNDTFFPLVVIGNKTDLRDEKDKENHVDQSSILSWCRENSYGHIETSAKDGNGIEAAMLAITALALENYKNRQISNSNKSESKVDLNKVFEKKKESFCAGCL